MTSSQILAPSSDIEHCAHSVCPPEKVERQSGEQHLKGSSEQNSRCLSPARGRWGSPEQAW